MIPSSTQGSKWRLRHVRYHVSRRSRVEGANGTGDNLCLVQFRCSHPTCLSGRAPIIETSFRSRKSQLCSIYPHHSCYIAWRSTTGSGAKLRAARTSPISDGLRSTSPVPGPCLKSKPPAPNATSIFTILGPTC